MKSGVYKISNIINDSVYVGSSKYVKQRISQHKYALRENKNSNRKLQAFFNEHGIDSLIFEIIEYCPIVSLKQNEQYYLNTIKDKFNISEFSASTKGVRCSIEKRKLISESLKKAGLKGIKKSYETRQRMSKPKSESHRINIKKAQEKVIKKVYQYDLNIELIKAHRSITDAAKNTGVRRGDISAACNGRQKTAKNYIWSFRELLSFKELS